MGHFSYSCKLSGLPITNGTPAVLIVMKLSDKLYNNGEEHLRNYGSTCLVSNDGAQVKFNPVWYPIHCDYDDYGGAENIVKDDNTELLEKHYGLSIEELVDIVTSGRKDDGYSGVLKVIKDPTKKDKYGEPKYLERYKELLTYSGMWVHGELYNQLTKEVNSDEYDKVNLGTPEILEALGFEEVTDKKIHGRYDRKFTKDNLTVYSDSTWINIPNEHVYTLPQFKEYCKRHGVEIEIDEINKKDRVEQFVDYVIPNVKSIGRREFDSDSFVEASNKYKKMSEEEQKSDEGKKLVKIMASCLNIQVNEHPQHRTITYLLLNHDTYKVYNPMTVNYFNAVKEGKLRDNIVRFWRFDSYMFATGNYYDIIGTSPQDGDREKVMELLKVSQKVLKGEIKEREEW